MSDMPDFTVPTRTPTIPAPKGATEMKYELIGKPEVQQEYCDDEFETVLTFDLRREDGVIGTDVWIVAGVPDFLQGSSKAAGHQSGFETVRAFGDSLDCWCPPCFMPAEGEDASEIKSAILRAVEDAALRVHRERYYAMSR